MKKFSKIIFVLPLIFIFELLMIGNAFAQGVLPPGKETAAPLDNYSMLLLAGGLGYVSNYAYGILKNKNKNIKE